MTTRETRTERVVQRSYGGSTSNGRLDNNLDNLLEDLQNSVSRPITPSNLNGSGLHAGNYREYNTTQRTTSTPNVARNVETRVEYRSAANPITVPSEQSTKIVERSKDGTKEKTIHKTIKYEYDVTDSILPETNIRMQSNMNQLDTLLDDLQQARKGANINAGIDPGFLEPLEGQGSTKQQVSKKTVQRELLYGSPEHQSTTTVKTTRTSGQSPTTIRRTDREGSVTRDIVYTVDDGTYGDIRQTRVSSPPPTQQQTLNKKTVTTNVKNYNYNTIDTSPQSQVEVINPAILSDLDPSLLPNPNTKVTTTIKTYTYEIPGTPNTGYPSRVQSPTHDERYIYNVSPSPGTLNRNQTTVYKEEKNSNYYGSSPSPVTTVVEKTNYGSPPPQQMTTIYKEENKSNFYGSSPPPQPVNYQTTVYKEDVRTTNKYGEFVPPKTVSPVRNYPQGGNYPPGNTTIIHKTETYNNNTYGRNSPNRYPRDDIPRGNNYPEYPRNYPPSPKSPVNVTYQYSSEHTSANKYTGYPPAPGSPYANDDRKPLLQPGKFPTEPKDHEPTGPPKKLDDLMAQFNGGENITHTTNVYNTTTTSNNRYIDERDSTKQKLLSDDKNGGPVQITETQKKKDLKDLPKSKNVTGPPVYYPPGHEMFAKKEESAAAYRAQGGYAKASGKYEYEAESKSKTKTSSGAAVVPVCLPLCCAMPCSII